jgi:hypothetical protein
MAHKARRDILFRPSGYCASEKLADRNAQTARKRRYGMWHALRVLPCGVSPVVKVPPPHPLPHSERALGGRSGERGAGRRRGSGLRRNQECRAGPRMSMAMRRGRRPLTWRGQIRGCAWIAGSRPATMRRLRWQRSDCQLSLQGYKSFTWVETSRHRDKELATSIGESYSRPSPSIAYPRLHDAPAIRAGPALPWSVSTALGSPGPQLRSRTGDSRN